MRLPIERSAHVLASIASLVVAGLWFLHPQAVGTAVARIHAFPLQVMLTSFDDAAPRLPQLVLLSLFAASLALSALLVLRLAWGGLQQASTRYLARALSFGNFALGYFFFVRELSLGMAWLPASGWWLDAAGTIAYCYALVALVACFRIYPEPVTVDRVDRAFLDRLASETDLAARIRAGAGAWRLWSWLPGEAFGAYGRQMQPSRRGVARLLSSREFVWMLLFLAMVAAGMRWSRQLTDIGGGSRLLFWCVVALFALFCLDPVLWARARDGGRVSASLRRSTGRLASLELALHRLFASTGGLLLVAAFGVLLTWMWVGRMETAAELLRWMLAFSIMLVGGALLFGHGMNLLYLNWRHGVGEQRRAIAWIFLATVGTFVLWASAYLLLGLVSVFAWMAGVDAPLGRGLWSLGGVFRLGPPLVLFALVCSLWASILQRGSFDPGLALRRTTAYSIVAVLLTTLFVALEGVASASVVSGLGLSPSGGALVAGSAVALAFNPIRNRVEKGVERLVDRLRPANLLAEGERSVAAVMFSDLVGYTALSGSDEKAALTVAALFHKEARRAAEAYGGRLVKTIGDATLTVFPDSASALSALSRIEAKFRAGSGLLELPALPIHSGIHVGEIVAAPDGDVFGATVNIAARLEGRAQGGQAVLSEAAAVGAQAAGFVLRPLGMLSLKNVAEPIACSVWSG
jgi:class 3 adenylate cyclase